MKHFISISILFLAFQGYSQTSIKTQPYSRESLNSYLWSFSKNSSKPGGKALVDFDVMDKWRGIGNYLSVSDDGNYFAYTMNKMVYNMFKFGLFDIDSLVIQSTKTGRRTVFTSGEPGVFTSDSKQYIFKDGNALCFLQLRGMQMRKISDVASYKVSPDKWLAYQLKDKNDLILQNLVTGKEKQFPGISGFDFDASGTWLVGKNNAGDLLLYGLATGAEKGFPRLVDYLFSKDGKGIVAKTNANLQYINLLQGDTKIIWEIKEKTGLAGYSLDATGKQVLFTIIDSTNGSNNMIGYYEQGMDKAVVKISNQTEGFAKGLTISNASFRDNGRYINLALQSIPDVTGKPDDNMAGVEVWNTKDDNLKSKNAEEASAYKAIVNIESGKVTFLEGPDKKIFLLGGDFVLVKKDYKSAYGDRFWEKRRDSCWLVSLKDGSSRLLPAKPPYSRFWFSPSGNYLVYLDVDKGSHYYSYDLHSGNLNDITAHVPENTLAFVDRQNDQLRPGNLAAWIEGEDGVLAYDNYDIWKLDLTGKSAAVNITNGFGQANSIVLNLFKTDHYLGEPPVIKANKALILRAFNRKTKQRGFYKKANLNAGTPMELYMGDYFINKIWGCDDDNFSNEGMVPVKAKNSEVWIVQRQSTSDAPNYYQTTDFKNYKRLTDYQPQKAYQWLTEELHSFKHLDGEMGQGILYKPENFDPNKKYPVIIPFYEQFSNNVYQFHAPSYLDQAMETGRSPLWLLNNGFLVFTPDIQVTSQEYGPSTYNVIEGAAQYLKQLPYVDGEKLGCGAHSWSSKLGAYMFTHSTSIAATTISGCATYNPIANGLSPTGHGLKELEGGQEWGSLWENKDAWLDLTAVLQADKAKGALLLLENKESSPNYQDQAFQFFNALRRLDKNVWWLKYDKGGHTLSDHEEIQDYTVRYTQFFDHYLKNAPAPMWMTQGIPLKLKQVESRYELDPQGKCNTANGEACPICEAWNKQYKRNPAMFEKEIKDWVLDKDIAEALRQAQDERRKQLDKEGEVRTKEVMEMLKK